MSEIRIQKVDYLELHKIAGLVNESEGEGFRHLRRLITEYEAGGNKFDKDGEALFIAYQNSDVVGVCGLNKDPYANSKEVGRVRRLYVSPKVRRFGIGRRLMDAVIAEARKQFKILVLKTDHPVAFKFYRSIGFSNHDGSDTFSHMLILDCDDRY